MMPRRVVSLRGFCMSARRAGRGVPARAHHVPPARGVQEASVCVPSPGRPVSDMRTARLTGFRTFFKPDRPAAALGQGTELKGNALVYMPVTEISPQMYDKLTDLIFII